jgi:type VI secretion system protein ImpH
LFYRAWTKYRLPVTYERDEGRRGQDLFTNVLLSLVGLGEAGLRDRLRVTTREKVVGVDRPRVLQQVPDLGLLYYAGFLAHRPRCAVNLEAMLQDYFGIAVRVLQFRGQWLRLDPANQSRFVPGGNTQLGVNVVAGSRVWDTQSKFRLRLGPLRYAEFVELLPDRTPQESRKMYFLVCHLTRLFVGPAFDFEVQLVLRAEDVPACRLGEGSAVAPQLGWNTWMVSEAYPNDAEDAVFEAAEPRHL